MIHECRHHGACTHTIKISNHVSSRALNGWIIITIIIISVIILDLQLPKCVSKYTHTHTHIYTHVRRTPFWRNKHRIAHPNSASISCANSEERCATETPFAESVELSATKIFKCSISTRCASVVPKWNNSLYCVVKLKRLAGTTASKTHKLKPHKY